MQPNIDFLSAIILFGIIQGMIVLALLLWKKPQAYIWFSLFLGALLWQEVESFLYYSGYLIHVPHLYYLSTPFVFLAAPALLFYTRQLGGKEMPKKKRQLHFIPFVVYFLYSCFFYFQPLKKKIHAYLTAIDPSAVMPVPAQTFDADPLEIQGYIVAECIGLYLIGYGLYGLLKMYRTQIAAGRKRYFSWILLLNVILLGSGLVLLMAEGGVVEGTRLYYPVLPAYMTRVYVTASLYVITIYLLFNTKLFKSEQKYQKSSLTKTIRQAKRQKILAVLENEKPYLSPTYSLGALAQKVNMPASHITEVLNLELNMTFYTLTNQYRIQEAKQQLARQDHHWKMDQLAAYLGYKSKSTFYNAFKKEMACTPLQYKKSLGL